MYVCREIKKGKGTICGVMMWILLSECVIHNITYLMGERAAGAARKPEAKVGSKRRRKDLKSIVSLCMCVCIYMYINQCGREKGNKKK